MPAEVLEKFKEQQEKRKGSGDDGAKMEKRKKAKEKAQKYKKDKN